MDIRTSDKTGIITSMGCLKGRKHNKIVLKSSLKFSQKYKGSLFEFFFILVNTRDLTKTMVHSLSFL